MEFQLSSNTMRPFLSGLLQQFHKLHPEHELEAGTNFSLMLFESLVLLRSVASEALNPTFDVGSEENPTQYLRANALEEAKLYLRRRMLTVNSSSKDYAVLCGRNPLEQFAEPSVRALEGRVFYGRVSDNSSGAYSAGTTSFALFRVLNRFMVLSARIVTELPNNEINQYWMRSACQLMLHTALQAARDSCKVDASTPSCISSAAVRPGILECFAFRHLPAEVLNTDTLKNRASPTWTGAGSTPDAAVKFDPSSKDEEIAISDMFEARSDQWDSMRHSYLSEFALPRPSAKDADETDPIAGLLESYRQRLPRLQQKYPYEEMEASVIECLENLWSINHLPSYSGKPVLVQIEEGHLEGLDAQEFETFLKRVGLDARQVDMFG